MGMPIKVGVPILFTKERFFEVTESEKKRIKDLYESGMPLERIQRLVSVGRGAFLSCIKEMRKNGEICQFRQRTEDVVVRLYDEGCRDVNEIARKIGVKPKTAYIYLHRNERFFGKKTHHSYHCDRTVAIVEDIKDGELSITAIAKKHGVSRQYVSKVREKVNRGIFDD